MGDPNGVGPEIILKAIGDGEVRTLCEPLLFGDRGVFERAKDLLSYSPSVFDDIKIVSLTNLDPTKLTLGKPQGSAGEGSLLYIKEAVRFAIEKKIDAVVTAPISKEALHISGAKYPGHTELLAELTGAKRVAMMFESPRMRVVLLTIHCALSEVSGKITEDRVLSTIELTHESLANLFGIPTPKIVVSALNPHAGEGGAFGNEESLYITPAIERAKEKGINVEGPIPADSLFYWVLKGRWDTVVAMYHDQGLIPFKMVSFEDGVNVTLGLPIIRTSPDHGTAYDIAWKGVASPKSLIAAIKVAVRLAKGRGES